MARTNLLRATSFLSTPSRRGRRDAASIGLRQRHFYPRPRVEGDVDGADYGTKNIISTHALA